MAEIIMFYAMKSVVTFFDYFFGLGAVLVLLDLTLFDGGIENMMELPYPLKVVIGCLMACYLFLRVVDFGIRKYLELREKWIELKEKEKLLNK